MSSAAPVKAKKENRKWDGVVNKKDASELDYSGGCNEMTTQASTNGTDRKEDYVSCIIFLPGKARCVSVSECVRVYMYVC